MVFPSIHIDFHTKLFVFIVVGLVFRPGVIPNPGAVIANPGPGFIFVASGDSNPVIRTSLFVWQDGHHIVVLFLALDDHHVCIFGPAPLSGRLPVHGVAGVVIRPTPSNANQIAS